MLGASEGSTPRSRELFEQTTTLTTEPLPTGFQLLSLRIVDHTRGLNVRLELVAQHLEPGETKATGSQATLESSDGGLLMAAKLMTVSRLEAPQNLAATAPLMLAAKIGGTANQGIPGDSMPPIPTPPIVTATKTVPDTKCPASSTDPMKWSTSRVTAENAPPTKLAITSVGSP